MFENKNKFHLLGIGSALKNVTAKRDLIDGNRPILLISVIACKDRDQSIEDCATIQVAAFKMNTFEEYVYIFETI